MTQVSFPCQHTGRRGLDFVNKRIIWAALTGLMVPYVGTLAWTGTIRGEELRYEQQKEISGRRRILFGPDQRLLLYGYGGIPARSYCQADTGGVRAGSTESPGHYCQDIHMQADGGHRGWGGDSGIRPGYGLSGGGPVKKAVGFQPVPGILQKTGGRGQGHLRHCHDLRGKMH